MARELEGNWTTFTPHYIVWVCPDVYRSSDECQQQCIHNGRYCTPDPDGDLMAGYSGKDVVQVLAYPMSRCSDHCLFHVATVLSTGIEAVAESNTPAPAGEPAPAVCIPTWQRDGQALGVVGICHPLWRGMHHGKEQLQRGMCRKGDRLFLYT